MRRGPSGCDDDHVSVSACPCTRDDLGPETLRGLGRRAHRPQTAATADDALALTLGGAAPDTVVLTMADRVLEAVGLDGALGAG